MSTFDQELKTRLESIRAQGLFRELRRVDSPQGPRLRIGDQELINFSSNDYLGLANHPTLKEAAVKATEEFGAGAGASRLICGSLAPFHELEETLAAFKGTEAALTFSTGYATAIGTITALLGKDDIIILDKLVHASIVDAAKLSGAKIRVFAHNDLNDLEDKLQWSSHFSSSKHTLLITESVFSMDGDVAPLKEIVELKEKHGAWLMVDEAHATGLYGVNRRGLAEQLDVSEDIEIQLGTLGKALGASGGYICGSRALIDFLINRARSFIFSTAPVPAAAAAAQAGIQLVQSTEGKTRCDLLWQLANSLLVGTRSAASHSQISNKVGDGVERVLTQAEHRAIIPILIGDEAKATTTANALREQGFFIPAIRYPTVARGSARLRVTLTAAHSAGEIADLTNALIPIVNRKS